MHLMEIIQVYKCFCDLQRLRILNLLKEGPLCVCHLVEILDSEQVKISKQLRYMKEQGMLEDKRVAQWKVYRLAEVDNPLLQENLKCLQDCYSEVVDFGEDSKKRAEITIRMQQGNATCAQALKV